MTDGFPDIDRRSGFFHGLTQENLASVTAGWAKTDATPPAVAGLLAESRRLFVGGAHTYDNFVAAPLKALHAADLALKIRLGLPDDIKRTLGQLVRYERDVRPVLSPQLRQWYSTPALTLRNQLSHPDTSMALTPGASAPIVESVHNVVAEMFPDA
jgi:hypothetical protein